MATASVRLSLLLLGACVATEAAGSGKEAPLWTAFNATMYKTGAIGRVWAKIYYDWDGYKPYGAQREDFYNGYPDPYTGKWTLNCTILFTNDEIWWVFPEAKACHLRSSSGIPSVSPGWLRNLGAKYVNDTFFRGVLASQYSMPDPANKTHIMDYYALSSDTRVPLRSTNQVNDPGSTDYFDVELGSQQSTLFAVPDYCKDRRTTMTCG